MAKTLSSRFRSILFDEEQYFLDYPDVALAVAKRSFRSGLDHYLRHGLREGRLYAPPRLLRRFFSRSAGNTISYETYLAEIEAPFVAELDRTAAGCIAAMKPPPLLSVVMPVCDPEPEHLSAAIGSILAQSYPHWQLCVSDDASGNQRIREMLREFAAADARIRLHFREERGHICRATNDALSMADGEFVAFVDHDDLLPRHALFLMASAVNTHRDAVLIYGDEDKVNASGFRSEPHFKPAFDPDLLLGHNYITHLMAARTASIRAAGGLRPGYEGSQDHDLALRLTQSVASNCVVHVPGITYHWRRSAGSTSSNVDSKPYAEAAGRAAVEDALTRRGIAATVTPQVRPRSTYRVRYALPGSPPRVTVIIPTRESLPLLRRCVETLIELTDYPDFEVVVVDNGSVREDTIAYLQSLPDDPRFRVIRVDSEFNYSALNNRAVEVATGTVLCLLNNDTEVLKRGWLREMVSQALRPDVGCVGARLLYPDGRVQHSGVILRGDGVAEHLGRVPAVASAGDHGLGACAHEVSAVTGACLVVTKALYESLGGLDETNLRVAYNDVDLCLRARAAGRRNILTPHATLIHHESANRKLVVSSADPKQFEREKSYMLATWGDVLSVDSFAHAGIVQAHAPLRESRTIDRHGVTFSRPIEERGAHPVTPPPHPGPERGAPLRETAALSSSRQQALDLIHDLKREVLLELALSGSRRRARIEQLFEVHLQELKLLPFFASTNGPAEDASPSDDSAAADIRRELDLARAELQRIHDSKLWKVATLYWRALHALGLMKLRRR